MDQDTESDADRALEQRAKLRLRRLVSDIPPEMQARLDDSARRAAREARRGFRAGSWRVALPVGGGLAAAALAMVMFRAPATLPGKAAESPPDDMALLLNVDNLDLLEQMEFYQWLDREPDLLEGAAAGADAQRS